MHSCCSRSQHTIYLHYCVEFHYDYAVVVVTVQLPHSVQLFATPWTAAHQTSLSFTISWSLIKLLSIESVILSNHLILCHPLLLLPSVFSSIAVFSNALSFPAGWLFSSGGQSMGTSASSTVLPVSIQDWLPLILTGVFTQIFIDIGIAYGLGLQPKLQLWIILYISLVHASTFLLNIHTCVSCLGVKLMVYRVWVYLWLVDNVQIFSQMAKQQCHSYWSQWFLHRPLKKASSFQEKQFPDLIYIILILSTISKFWMPDISRVRLLLDQNKNYFYWNQFGRYTYQII